MARAFLSMGSNLGARRLQLQEAVKSLLDVKAVSPVYETDPVGGPAQGPYLNLVVELDTDLSARELLGRALELEAAAGRVRRERWGPRTLDVDVLWVEGETVDEDDLHVPHPRMSSRAFVMVPLADLAEEWREAAEQVDASGVRLIGQLFDD